MALGPTCPSATRGSISESSSTRAGNLAHRDQTGQRVGHDKRHVVRPRVLTERYTLKNGVFARAKGKISVLSHRFDLAAPRRLCATKALTIRSGGADSGHRHVEDSTVASLRVARQTEMRVTGNQLGRPMLLGHGTDLVPCLAARCTNESFGADGIVQLPLCSCAMRTQKWVPGRIEGCGASFTRYVFEAAAITAFVTAAGAVPSTIARDRAHRGMALRSPLRRSGDCRRPCFAPPRTAAPGQAGSLERTASVQRLGRRTSGGETRFPPAGPARERPSASDRCDTPRVPTEIYFPGDNVRVKVDQDPAHVAEAFSSAQGLPFRLTSQGDEIYINPAAVAFWFAADPAPAPDPEESEEGSPARDTVTDIWGRPLRKKPRR